MTQTIGNLIIRVIDGLASSGADGNDAVEKAVAEEVVALCKKFPIYND